MNSLGQIDREFDCGKHATRVGRAGTRIDPSQIERSPVVDGGTHEGQSERDVDAVAEARVLQHGNRETSETPAAKPSSRAVGEGNSRTARIYVPEESHDGIVRAEQHVVQEG